MIELDPKRGPNLESEPIISQTIDRRAFSYHAPTADILDYDLFKRALGVRNFYFGKIDAL